MNSHRFQNTIAEESVATKLVPLAFYFSGARVEKNSIIIFDTVDTGINPLIGGKDFPRTTSLNLLEDLVFESNPETGKYIALEAQGEIL